MTQRAWPVTAAQLEAEQERLAAERPAPWRSPGGDRPLAVAGCWVCFPRGQRGRGRLGDPGWAGAALLVGRRLEASAVATGRAGAPYEPGLLALREGPLLASALQALDARPDVVLADATGRDHPRRAGLALHLGAVLGLPTVGVTSRPLLAEGQQPGPKRGARADLRVRGGAEAEGGADAEGGAVGEGEVVACWLRTREGARPLVVHPGWRTDVDAAVEVVLAACRGHRAPEPLRLARRVAREARGRAARAGPR
jgi:deoxyribonuclease V